jgi:hypothetical protein
MKLALGMIVGAVVASCSASPPTNCEDAEQNLLQCMSEYGPIGSRELLLNCVPYSKSERISGTWAHGFEFNEFYEGEAVSVHDALQSQERSVKLLEPENYFEKFKPVPTRVSTIVVEGRRPLCNFFPDEAYQESWIVVDRIISERTVFSRPYG